VINKWISWKIETGINSVNQLNNEETKVERSGLQGVNEMLKDALLRHYDKKFEEMAALFIIFDM
jgi:hypothetical protein